MLYIISKSLKFLQNYLNNNSDGDFIELANIATLNDGDEFIESPLPIIMSIVNIEDDKTMRNPNIYNGGNYKDKKDIVEYKLLTNPILNLNIYILFSSYEKKQSSSNKYTGTIDQLEKVISSFQKQNVFLRDDFIKVVDGNTTNTDKYPEETEKIVLEMVNLSMEGLNQMWSFLGSKYMPSVLYKMKVVSIMHEDPTEKIKPINSFEIQKYDGNSEADSLLLENKFYTNEIIKEELKNNTNN